MGDLPFHDPPLCLFCLRYEEEVSLRATAENEFVALKKVSHMGSGSTDMWDLRMTDSCWGVPEGLNLSVGYSDLANSVGGFPEIRSWKAHPEL